ncbi:MAG: hypothetical protein QOF25_4309 [Mycobacterium sp.]|nr:hypothetical protein [Mycobacterium sp.]
MASPRGAARDTVEMGAEQVVLFTDLANPVSNAIYQRFGFEPVSDWVTIALSAGVPGRVP